MGTKKVYASNLIERINRKRIYVENSRRSVTKLFYLINNAVRVQVCQQMFLSTLGISEKMLRLWVDSSDFHGTQMCPEEKNTLRSVAKRVTKQGKQYEDV